MLFRRINEANDILLRTAADEDGHLIDKDAFEEKMHKYCSSCCSPSQQDPQNTYREPVIPSIFLIPQDFTPYRVYEKSPAKLFPKYHQLFLCQYKLVFPPQRNSMFLCSCPSNIGVSPRSDGQILAMVAADECLSSPLFALHEPGDLRK